MNTFHFKVTRAGGETIHRVHAVNLQEAHSKLRRMNPGAKIAAITKEQADEIIRREVFDENGKSR